MSFITFLLKPLTLVVLSLCIGFFFKKRILLRRTFLILGFVLLWIFTNPFLANEAMLVWEENPTPYSEMSKTYDFAVVLSGVTNNNKTLNDRVFLNKGADRVTHTFSLYKKGIVKRILISGNGKEVGDRDARESSQMRNLFIEMGVDPAHIVLEDESNSTYENAVQVAKLMNSTYKGKNFILVTSAFHCKRAMACFEGQGLDFDVFPVDFYSKDTDYSLGDFVVPSVESMLKWEIVIKECIGYMYYSVFGKA